MSTFERASNRRRAVAAGLVAMALGLLAAHCTGSDACVRFSDCDDGMTCGAGHCVPAATPGAPDAALDGPTNDAAPFDAAPPPVADASDGEADASADAADLGDADLGDAALADANAPD